jgi:hypothetical protein
MALAMAVFPAPALAQATDGYDVTWHTVDGGGVMWATGNGYKVGGTIGQPDAGKLSGGAYAVTGGFWALAPACPTPNPPLAEPSVPHAGFGTRVRYMSFTGGTPGAQEAVRVTFADMPAEPQYYDFTYAEWRQMWVGQPRQVTEQSGNSGSTPPPTFWAATLQCDPYFTVWSTYGAVHVYGESIVPKGTYDVQLVLSGCAASEANFSTALSVDMSKWGDTVGANNPASPQGAVDFNDISSIVDKFKNLPGAPTKSRADVAPDVPDQIVDFSDIPAVVDAFRGVRYPFDGPPVVDPCE